MAARAKKRSTKRSTKKKTKSRAKPKKTSGKAKQVKHHKAKHKSQTSSSGADFWKIATLVLVIITAVLLFKHFGGSGAEGDTGASDVAVPDQAAPTPSAQFLDTGDDPDIGLTVITTEKCPICDPTPILTTLKGQPFPTIQENIVTYESAEGARLVAELGIKALPAFIFEKEVTQGANYPGVADALIQKGDVYVVSDAAVNAPYALNLPEVGNSATKGVSDAPLTIIEYSDFQCPFCARAHTEALVQLEEDYIKTGKVKLVYKHLPLQIHPLAPKAAEAAECAREEGKFWEMHDRLFASNGDLAEDRLVAYAKELGLNEGAFSNCLSSGKHTGVVVADVQQATALGITGTPTFYIGNIKVSGALPYDAFKQVIDMQLIN